MMMTKMMIPSLLLLDLLLSNTVTGELGCSSSSSSGSELLFVICLAGGEGIGEDEGGCGKSHDTNDDGQENQVNGSTGDQGEEREC